MAARKNNTLSFSQRLQIYEFLKDRLNPKDEYGFVSYKNGWSDVKVAAKFKCTRYNVSSIRIDSFGEVDNLNAKRKMAAAKAQTTAQTEPGVTGKNYDERRKAFWAGYNDLKNTVKEQRQTIADLTDRISHLEREWFGPPTRPEPVPSDMDQVIHRKEA